VTGSYVSKGEEQLRGVHHKVNKLSFLAVAERSCGSRSSYCLQRKKRRESFYLGYGRARGNVGEMAAAWEDQVELKFVQKSLCVWVKKTSVLINKWAGKGLNQT